MALKEVIDEIKDGVRQKRDAPDAPKEKPAPAKKAMTKAEIAAYRQKMIAKEEARYLKKEKPAPAKKAKAKQPKPEPKVCPSAGKKPAVKTPANAPKELKMPKMIQPLQPLFLLHIPGLPKGDGIVICLAHGVEQ